MASEIDANKETKCLNNSMEFSMTFPQEDTFWSPLLLDFDFIPLQGACSTIILGIEDKGTCCN